MAKRKYAELFMDKGLNELFEMQAALSTFINDEKDRLEAEKEAEIREGMNIGDTVYVLDGKGAEAQPVKAKVIIMTETGITGVLEDGRKVNRRYKKLMNEKEAKNWNR